VDADTARDGKRDALVTTVRDIIGGALMVVCILAAGSSAVFCGWVALTAVGGVALLGFLGCVLSTAAAALLLWAIGYSLRTLE
jgi:hypothetical protein